MEDPDVPDAATGSAEPWRADPCWRILVELWRREAEGRPSASLRELAAETDLSSLSVVQKHLLKLRSEGLVTWEPFHRRTLRLTDGGRWAVNSALRRQESEPLDDPVHPPMRSSVAAIELARESKVDGGR